MAVSPFVFEEFAGGLLDERGVVVCHSKGGAQTNQKGYYYLPLEDVRSELLEPSDHHSFCTVKGQADYWTVRVGVRSARNAAWSYAESPDEVTPAGYIAFYAHLLDACLVDDEKATPPPWSWPGGWVTGAGGGLVHEP